jgi:hypothetical protein
MKTVTDMSGFRQLNDEELEHVCGGFNPQPDPPARLEIWSNTLLPSSLILSPSNPLTSKG